MLRASAAVARNLQLLETCCLDLKKGYGRLMRLWAAEELLTGLEPHVLFV
jgi:hypothetical protein